MLKPKKKEVKEVRGLIKIEDIQYLFDYRRRATPGSFYGNIIARLCDSLIVYTHTHT